MSNLMNYWRQDVSDLMARENIKIIVTGEMNDVDAILYIWVGGSAGDYKQVADVIGADDLESAMAELLGKFKDNNFYGDRSDKRKTGASQGFRSQRELSKRKA